MFWPTLIFSQSCSSNKEICLAPSVSGSTVTVDITFTPFTGYLAFGYGGQQMTNENMVILMPSGTGFTADSYFSTTMSTPKKVANVWKVVSSSAGKVTITGSDKAFPETGGQFSWASGLVSAGAIMQHSDKVGTFKVDATAYKVATPSSAPSALTSTPVASPLPAAQSPSQSISTSIVPPTPSELPSFELTNIPRRSKCKNSYSPVSSETASVSQIADVPISPYATEPSTLPTETGASGYPSSNTPGDVYASSSSSVKNTFIILAAVILQ